MRSSPVATDRLRLRLGAVMAGDGRDGRPLGTRAGDSQKSHLTLNFAKRGWITAKAFCQATP